MRGGSASGARCHGEGVNRHKPQPTILTQTAELRCYRSAVEGLRDLPGTIRVAPWGLAETPNGPMLVDEVTAEVLPVNQAAMNYVVVAGDYEHGTAKPGPRQEPQEIPCRGTVSVVRPGNAEGMAPGLYFTVTEWTESGRKFVGGGHYPGVSLACLQDEEGRVLFVHSVGFVRNPAVPGMSVFSVNLGGDMPAKSTKAKATNKMNEKYRAAMITALKKMGKTVPDDVTDDDLITMFEAATGGEEPAAPELATFNVALGRIEKQLNGLTERLARSEASAADSARAAVVAGLAAEGVEIPLSADMLQRFSADELLAESAKWPRGTVPRDASLPLPAGLRTYGAGGSGDSAADKASIAAQLKLDPKEF